jgi:hypothetical protein
MKDQSTLALRLLQGFLTRAAAEHHPQRCLILDSMRRIRQRQAEQEFEAMELAHGKVTERSGEDFDELPF